MKIDYKAEIPQDAIDSALTYIKTETVKAIESDGSIIVIDTRDGVTKVIAFWYDKEDFFKEYKLKQ